MLLRWRGRKGREHQGRGLLGFTRIYCSQQQASGTQDGSGGEGGGCRTRTAFRDSLSPSGLLVSQFPQIKTSMTLDLTSPSPRNHFPYLQFPACHGKMEYSHIPLSVVPLPLRPRNSSSTT